MLLQAANNLSFGACRSKRGLTAPEQSIVARSWNRTLIVSPYDGVLLLSGATWILNSPHSAKGDPVSSRTIGGSFPADAASARIPQVRSAYPHVPVLPL
jgi:hypothetical protein